MMVTAPGYSLSAVSYSYGRIPGVSDLNISLTPGKFYGLIGPNGSGKSTLLDLLSGFTSPDHGTILLNGTPIASLSRNELSKTRAVVPQFFKQSFPYLVSEVVMMGRYPHLSRFAPPTKVDCQRVEWALAILNIYHLRSRPVTGLSGGEKQRVMLAKALAQASDFILLDEVTSNLDINHTISIISILLNLIQTEGLTVIAAIHDLNLAAACCDALIVLQNGSIKACGPTSTLLTERLIAELYGVEAQIISGQDSTRQIVYNYLKDRDLSGPREPR